MPELLRARVAEASPLVDVLFMVNSNRAVSQSAFWLLLCNTAVYLIMVSSTCGNQTTEQHENLDNMQHLSWLMDVSCHSISSKPESWQITQHLRLLRTTYTDFNSPVKSMQMASWFRPEAPWIQSVGLWSQADYFHCSTRAVMTLNLSTCLFSNPMQEQQMKKRSKVERRSNGLDFECRLQFL